MKLSILKKSLIFVLAIFSLSGVAHAEVQQSNGNFFYKLSCTVTDIHQVVDHVVLINSEQEIETINSLTLSQYVSAGSNYLAFNYKCGGQFYSGMRSLGSASTFPNLKIDYILPLNVDNNATQSCDIGTIVRCVSSN